MTRNQYLAAWGSILAILIVLTGIAGLYDMKREIAREKYTMIDKNLPTIMLTELDDRLAEYHIARLATSRQESDRECLDAIDHDLVQWFHGHGIELVVDCDPVTNLKTTPSSP